MEEALRSLPLAELVGMLLCLLASASFSFSETLLTRITESKGRHLLDEDPVRHRPLRRWLDEKPRLLATLLVGNNLVNILCSILGYQVAIALLPERLAEVLSVLGVTAIVLVFGEITPKSLALHLNERHASTVLRVLWVLDKLLYPLAWLLARIPALLMRRRLTFGAEEPPVTEGEIEFQIRLGADQEVFEEKTQGELLLSAVEFGDTTVKEIMVPRTDIVALDLGTPFAEAVSRVIAIGHSRIPVYRDTPDEVVGLLYSKDLLRALHDPAGHPGGIADYLRRPILFVPETQKINLLLAEMRRRRQHLAIVVDEFGGTAGLVTLEDIIEELVGEIRDEFDEEQPLARRGEDGKWLVDARMSIADLADLVGIEVPDTGEYESVGGYVMAACGCIPEPGRVIDAPEFVLRVLASDARRVERLELEVKGRPGTAEGTDA